jgi:hypothetical protein
MVVRFSSKPSIFARVYILGFSATKFKIALKEASSLSNLYIVRVELHQPESATNKSIFFGCYLKSKWLFILFRSFLEILNLVEILSNPSALFKTAD